MVKKEVKRNWRTWSEWSVWAKWAAVVAVLNYLFIALFPVFAGKNILGEVHVFRVLDFFTLYALQTLIIGAITGIILYWIYRFLYELYKELLR